jgi:hypothetical protein
MLAAMMRFRGLRCSGVLVLAIGCVRATPSTSGQTEVPAVAPVEREPVASTVEVARPTPEQILGLTLDDPRVQQFVEGAQFEEARYDDRVYEVSNVRGFDLLLEGGVITTIFLHALGHEDHQQYAEPMPGGIQFGDPPERVHQLLGAPDIQGSPRGSWDKWLDETWSAHVEYGSGGGIEMVTLMTAASDPNRQ